MICYSLAEDHRIIKTKMLRINHWSPWQMLLPKYSLTLQLRAKIVIPPNKQFLRNLFPPAEEGVGEAIMKALSHNFMNNHLLFSQLSFSI